MGKLLKSTIENPFKFGSVVDGEFFTNRVHEISQINMLLRSSNHLILIAPRRFGKTSLIKKILSENKVDNIFMNLQTVNNIDELASKLLKKVYALFKMEYLKNKIKNFRIVPNLNVNPLTQEVSVSFNSTGTDGQILLEDVLNLINDLSKPGKRLVCVFDEFQDVERIDSNLLRQLRSIMQDHTNLNYIFLGSQESMMKYIFDNKKSPFYHFGNLMSLDAISSEEFIKFIEKGFAKTGISINNTDIEELVSFTQCHPYYTQQLAYNIWNNIQLYSVSSGIVDYTVKQIIQAHDYDYERLWNSLNNTDRKVITGLCCLKHTPLSAEFRNELRVTSSSTILSSLKRLIEKGFIVYNTRGYKVEDPYFNLWVKKFNNV